MSLKAALQSIYDEHGRLDPQLVVDLASDPGHELHDRFVWDDSIAASRYRLLQAQGLIRSVKITVQSTPESQPVSVRAFISDTEIHGEQPDVGSYRPVEQVIESDVLRSAWFRSLERDWKRLKARAGASREFADMVLSDVADVA